MIKLLSILSLILSLNLYSQGDCPASLVCVGGAFTAQTGLIDELTPPNNGCLSVNEATSSYWFQICALTAGTIDFTISPSGNNNDYDFAVWNGTNCPPTVAPIRCSFAISNPGPGGDNTGVSSTNNAPQTDNSENAFGNQWVQSINALAGDCYTININNYGIGSDNFNLTFGGTATLNCFPLPVILTDFGCNSTDTGIVLNWSTQSELNNWKFEVQRTNDLLNWETIGTVYSQNSNSSQTQLYSFIDHFPLNGTNYYRLKQIDFNGVYEFYGPINCESANEINKTYQYYNLLGQEINKPESGVFIQKTVIGEFIEVKRIYLIK